MSIKRQATTQLNHDNWDQDDPAEHEEMGSFKTAPKDVLEKRVIRTAMRRSQPSGGEARTGAFSGFGGFNKPQPSSFDFLANLTNGNKNTNGSPNKSDTLVTSSLFSKPTPTSPSGGLFSTQESTSPKPIFGLPNSLSPISGVSATTSTMSSVFTATKADSTVGDSPFKIQPVVSSLADTSNKDLIKTTNTSSSVSTSQVTSTIFGIPPTSTNKSLFSTTINPSPFNIQPVSSTSTSVVQNNVTTLSTFNSGSTTSSDKKSDEKTDEKKVKYYTKLKGLNESVSNWIKKHVEATPICILSPIFKDYEKHLKEIQDEYQSSNKEDQNKSDVKTSMLPPLSAPSTQNKPTNSTLGSSDTSTVKPLFGIPNNAPTSDSPPTFTFGIKPTTTSATTATAGTGFIFGSTTPAQQSATPGNFTFGINTTTNSSNGTATFSFGTDKPFSFSSNVQTTGDKQQTNETEDEDAPPKVEFTPIVEENSVYDKRCKIFVKKDGNFVDKGVGTLYIKKVEETGKHQLLVRANTTLGNILLNLILVSAIPTQRTGKNNVMMVCIPTPESKPPPTPVLIRVKTSEEADELLDTLNKYKT